MKMTLSALNARYTHSSLALLYLQKFNAGKNIEIKEFTINDNIWDIYGELLNSDADIYGFSCYIWNIEMTLKVAHMLKLGKKDCKIFLGGPEVSYNASDILAKNDFIDYIVTGEGEIPVGNLYDIVLNGEKINDECQIVTGDYYGHKNAYLDLSKMPLPYSEEDLKRLEGKIIYFETSRGCPYNCSYCLSSAEHDLRYFPMEYVKQGFDLFFRNRVPLVKLIDRTFNANKKRAMEIIRYIMDNSICTKVHFEIAPQLLDDDIINLLNSAPKGLFQLEMGIQSTNSETLKSINRNADISLCANNIKKVKSANNMHIHLDLIAGLMYEDFESFGKSFDDVFYMQPDMLQLGFLKVLHGTEIKNETDIISAGFPPYEVISTKWISAMEICRLKEIENAVDKYYNSGAFKRIIKTLLENKRPFILFSEFADALKSVNGGVSRIMLYELLYKKYGDRIIKPLVYDYLQNNKSYKLPHFVERKEITDFKKRCRELLENDAFRKSYNIIYDLKNIRIEPVLDTVLITDYINGMIYDVGEYF